MSEFIFEDIMSPGIILSNKLNLSGIIKYYPDYLHVDQIMDLTINDKLDPSDLPIRNAITYKTNSLG